MHCANFPTSIIIIIIIIKIQSVFLYRDVLKLSVIPFYKTHSQDTFNVLENTQANKRAFLLEKGRNLAEHRVRTIQTGRGGDFNECSGHNERDRRHIDVNKRRRWKTSRL